MAPLGPWFPANTGLPVAVAVSGGADSTALAVLAATWARAHGVRLHALVVDHGLRAGSAAEAALAASRLEPLGVPVRVLTLRDLPPGAAIGERARRARYAALEAACAELGALDLLLGHHRGDQAETVAMRRRAGSGPDGLAGMARIAETGTVRRLRPLLGIDPGRLRATLRARGIPWVEDPTNRDERFERARVRAVLGAATVAELAAAAAGHGAERRRRAAEATAWLARNAVLRPEGFAVLRSWQLDDPVARGAVAALLRCIGGGDYPPPAASVPQPFVRAGGGTLGGVMVLPAGRFGGGCWLLVREPDAVGAAVPLRGRARWDDRFDVRGPDTGEVLEVGALGRTPPPVSGDLPAVVLRTLPAVRRNGTLLAVPHLGWAAPDPHLAFGATFRPPVPCADGGLFGPVGPFASARGVPICVDKEFCRSGETFL